MQRRAELQPILSLRLLVEADFPLMLTWLTKPHVKEWWDDGDDTLEKVARRYSEQTRTSESFILLYQGDSSAEVQPIGYLQYEVAEGINGELIAGIDQFIGEPDKINQGLGTQAIKLFIETIRSRHQVRMVTVDPAPANRRAIRCYEKVGFQHDDALPSPTGLEAYMMKIEF